MILKILYSIALLLAVISGAVLLIVPVLKQIPPNIQHNVILICLISLGCAIFLFLLFITPFGFGNIKEVTKFAQTLQVLKRENVQKSLLELKELSSIIERVKEKVTPDFILLDDYTQQYLYPKKIESIYVFGASLELTVTDEEYFSRLLKNLKRGIKCQYLCCGEKDDITQCAKQLAKRIKAVDINYLTEDNLSITWIESYLVMLPLNIFNTVEGKSDVLIFPYKGEPAIGQKCAIWVINKDVTQRCTRKFTTLQDKYKENKLPLLELANKS